MDGVEQGRGAREGAAHPMFFFLLALVHHLRLDELRAQKGSIHQQHEQPLQRTAQHTAGLWEKADELLCVAEELDDVDGAALSDQGVVATLRLGHGAASEDVHRGAELADEQRVYGQEYG